jgi:hypothetical protein
MDAPQLAHGNALFEFLNDVRSKDGVVVMTLLAVIWFLYRGLSTLTWRVWSATLLSKDREIARLILDRDRYQALVFERLRFLESLSGTRSPTQSHKSAITSEVP